MQQWLLKTKISGWNKNCFLNFLIHNLVKILVKCAIGFIRFPMILWIKKKICKTSSCFKGSGEVYEDYQKSFKVMQITTYCTFKHENLSLTKKNSSKRTLEIDYVSVNTKMMQKVSYSHKVFWQLLFISTLK